MWMKKKTDRDTIFVFKMTQIYLMETSIEWIKITKRGAMRIYGFSKLTVYGLLIGKRVSLVLFNLHRQLITSLSRLVWKINFSFSGKISFYRLALYEGVEYIGITGQRFLRLIFHVCIRTCSQYEIHDSLPQWMNAHGQHNPWQEVLIG